MTSKGGKAIKACGLRGLGYCLASLPFFCLWGLCWAVGLAYYALAGKRRRLLLSNWHHAFEDHDLAWIRAAARRSCAHLVELGLMGFLWPFWRRKTLLKRFSLAPEARALLETAFATPGPRIFLVPHTSLMEGLILIPLLFGPGFKGPFGVIYRPLKQPVLDDFIKKTRQATGFKLIARGPEGLKEAMQLLQKGGNLVVLFDQSPREKGWLGAFLGRMATTTALPGKLLERYHAQAYVCYPWHVKPFSAQMRIQSLQAKDAQALLQESNLWLEAFLRKNPDQAPTWLWAHDRWRIREQQEQCLQLPDLPCLPLPERMRSFRLAVILPQDPRHRLALRPMLEQLATCRPDVRLSLYLIEGESLSWEAPVIAFPAQSRRQASFFKQLRFAYLDAIIVCDPTFYKAAALTKTPLRLEVKGQELRGTRAP